MVLVIDNYDSFTYNVVHYLLELGASVSVHRNDALTVSDAVRMEPTHLVLSPGPGTPAAAGITQSLVRTFSGVCPILGVCLGHQAIGQVFGARLVRAGRLMHGKTCPVMHNGHGLFRGLPCPLTVARYHSLILEAASLPPALEVTAWTDQGEVMALAHRQFPVFGLQFHPESILSECGHELFARFLVSASAGGTAA